MTFWLLWSCRAREHKPLWSSESGSRRSLWGASAGKVGKERGGQGTSAFSGAGGERRPTPSAFRRPCLRKPSAPRGRGRVQNGVSRHLSRPRIALDTPGPSGWSFKTSDCIGFLCNPVTSQTPAFALLPRMSLCVRAPQQEYLRSLQHPGSRWFQSRMFWGPRLTGVGPRVGAPDVGHRQTLRSSGRGSAVTSLPVVWGFWWGCVSASSGGRDEFRVFVYHHLDSRALSDFYFHLMANIPFNF